MNPQAVQNSRDMNKNDEFILVGRAAIDMRTAIARKKDRYDFQSPFRFCRRRGAPGTRKEHRRVREKRALLETCCTSVVLRSVTCVRVSGKINARRAVQRKRSGSKVFVYDCRRCCCCRCR